jgi:hypothetical protein
MNRYGCISPSQFTNASGRLLRWCFLARAADLAIVTPTEPQDPLAVVERLVAALRFYDVVDIAVTGSTALGVWAAPRQSRDVDLCAIVPRDSVQRILARFDGISSGPSDHPDVLRLRFLGWDVPTSAAFYRISRK